MTWLDAIILGIVEGLTEFLPVSSTGHLTIVRELLGLPIDDPSITAFTAVIQVGAIVAVVIYFWSDIVRLLVAWWRGLFNTERRTDPDYRMAWLVIIGSIPIVVVGFLARDLIVRSVAQPVGGRRRADRLGLRHAAGRMGGPAGPARDAT